ncbi:5-hydroxytryptamine receptor-like protein [Dinothrombium tinctorium]|uniref:5-hydroxytryptamine receptor-like protein n=1 Tax=Dinothrombium tinctorium TaxID=1965070 RepID=A0A443QAZ3_9ACAR|nr:5-hydroxytryptamine receptor-like protein [Dinothrombium tinctorium]
MADNITSSKDVLILTEFKNVKLWLLSTVLVMLTLTTIVGNIFVICAILQEKALKTIGNYLILSLAITDLLVACIVMPIATIYEISGEWKLGSLLCDMWLSADVLCSTASILHLVAIAFDRYFAITNINYIHNRSKRKIGFMILIAWLISSIVSLAPIFGWKDADFDYRVENEKICIYSQNTWYQIFATFFSFYGPLLIVLYLYYRIYQETKRRIRRKRDTLKTITEHSRKVCEEFSFVSNQEVTIGLTAGDSVNETGAKQTSNEMITISTISAAQIESDNYLRPLPNKNNNTNKLTTSRSCVQIHYVSEPPATRIETVSEQKCSPKNERAVSFWGGIRRKLNLPIINESETANTRENREKKAAKILTIITGVFVVCWLPFFVATLMMPLCPKCVNMHLFSFFLWLGWTNSTLNPIIYTIFSPEFRRAFQKMLTCS